MSVKITSIDLGPRSYDIYIGSGLIYNLGQYLPDDADGQSYFIITDENVKPHAKTAHDTLIKLGAKSVQTITLPAGEETKSFAQYQSTCEWLLENGLKRDATIIAIGGGVIGDLAGYVAASIMRGVNFIQIPTSLLAQVDSSVGGKTGINTKAGKNLVGAFYQPQAVLADLETLQSLPERQIRAGYAEIVKYGLINDAPFFQWLEDNYADVLSLEPEAITYAIQKSVEAKAEIVQADERESGRRALLNLGHTFGHAIEAAAGYDGRILHGEAVAIGICMAFDTSHRAGLCSNEDLERVIAHFANAQLPTRISDITPALNTNSTRLIASMQKDKKATASGINFIMANGIGESFITSDIDNQIIESVIKDSLMDDNQGIKSRWISAYS